jgi:hypothetical protein
MSWWKWVLVATAVALGLAVLAGKDDIIRVQRMHNM